MFGTVIVSREGGRGGSLYVRRGRAVVSAAREGGCICGAGGGCICGAGVVVCAAREGGCICGAGADMFGTVVVSREAGARSHWRTCLGPWNSIIPDS